MRQHRKLLILAVLTVAVCLAGWIYWKWQKPPRIVQILPDGDRLLYVDLRPLHLWDWNKSKPLQIEGDYQQFVDQTGIRFEHDLDQAAVAWLDGGDASSPESAAVFVGRFDPVRLRKYLLSVSSASDSYHGRTVYSIPHEGHIVRVAILNDETIAVTTITAAEAMPGLIDHWDHPTGEPALLAQYYRRVPAGSLAWLLDRFPAGPGAVQLPDGLSFSFLENTVAVVSARYNGSLLLRADVLAASETDAKQLLDSATGFLSLYRGISNAVSRGSDRDVKAALDSIRVVQKGNAAIFTASLSQSFLKKMVQEAQPQILPASTPSPSPPPSTPKKSHRRSNATSR